MTSCYDLSTPGTPLLHKNVLEVPPNSTVRVLVKDGGYMFLGVCLQDPAKSARRDTLVLHQVVGTDPNDPTGTRYKFPTREFNTQDIARCELMGPLIDERAPPKDERPERIMVTQTVSKLEDVRSILDSIDNMNIKTVVVSILIEGTGRFGAPAWLCFVIRGLFVCMDIKNFKDNEQFWKLMENRIFRNEKLTKVCHNGRRLIDYLFNQKAIKIHNLYDTQLGEMYIRCHQNRDNMPERVDDLKDGSPYNWEYYPVSKIYSAFVPELLLPEELAHLKTYEGKQFNKNCPFLTRPVPASCPYHKCAALEVKYLEEVYDVQMKTLLSHITLVMREQTKLLYRANNTVTMERYYIPHNVMEMIKQGSPFLSSDRTEDYLF